MRGIDSYVGSFESSTLHVGSDYGWYSGIPDDRGQQGYTKKEIQIGGHRAIIVSYQLDKDNVEQGFKYFSAVHSPVPVEDENGDGIVANTTNELTMSALGFVV